MLAIVAVATAQLLFTKVMGPFAVLLGMLLLVVLGMPASNLALSVDTMPGFFGWLHGVLPLPAAGEALRSVLYFDGNGVWAPRADRSRCGSSPRSAWPRSRSASRGGADPRRPARTPTPTRPLPALSGGPVALQPRSGWSRSRSSRWRSW